MSPHDNAKPIARRVSVDVEADPVMAPVVHYGDPLTAILFPIDDERVGRVTFEEFDALRVCRGEFSPYEEAEDSDFSWVSIVENSPWLRERYEYEAAHYRDAYNFCGDVDEMLRDFHHYLFSFHDQFVEVIAAGIWIEILPEASDWETVSADHPLLALPESTVVDHVRAHGLVTQVRKNPLDTGRLLKQARLCSQPILHFALELDGKAEVDHKLNLRLRNGQPISQLKSWFCGVEAEFEGVADLATVRPYIEKMMREIRDRR